MKKRLSNVAALTWFALVGCGSADICSAPSQCSADPQPTQAFKDSCKAATAPGTKCASEYTALGNCFINNPKCTSANVTDPAAAGAACAAQAAAYGACVAPK